MTTIAASSELSADIPTIVAAEALGALKANTVMAGLASRDWESDVASYGDTVTISYGGALSVNDKAEDTVITLQAPVSAAYTVTLDKHKEVSFLVEDPAQAFSRTDWVERYLLDGIMALAEQIDGDLTGLYSGFSQTIDATTGIGDTTFREAARQLNSAKVPRGQRWAVLHEDGWYEFTGIEKAVNQDYRALGQAQSDAWIGRFHGFDVHMDQKIVATGGQTKNIFGHKRSMALATRPLAKAPSGMGVMQETMEEDGIGLRVTLSYDHDNLGVKCTIDVLYGVAELRDNHAVVVSGDEI